MFGKDTSIGRRNDPDRLRDAIKAELHGQAQRMDRQ